MAHEILSVKLCELENQLARLNSRIHLSETADHDRLRQEITTLSKEFAESELTLQKKLQFSKAEIITALANNYGEIEQIIQKATSELEKHTSSSVNADTATEQKILLAEYALDFTFQAANRALLLSLEAIDAQLTNQEKERSSL